MQLSHSRKTFAIAASILCLSGTFGIVAGGKQLETIRTQIAHQLLTQEITAPRYQLSIGQQYSYQLNYDSHAKSDLRVLFTDIDKTPEAKRNAPSSLVSDLNVKINSEVIITVLAKQGNNYLLSYRFNNPIVKILSKEQLIKQQSQLVTEDLKQDIVATVDPQGRIVAVQFAPKTAEISQTFARSILADMQFVTPNNSDRLREWTQQEEDQNGKFLAHYEAASSFENRGSILPFRKTKVQYFPRPSSTPSRQGKPKSDLTIHPQGEWQGKFDAAKGQLQELTGQETQKIIISNKEVGTDETKMSLKLQSVTTLPTIQPLQTKLQPQLKAPSIPLSYQVSEADAEAQIQKRQLGTDTLESISAALDRAEATRNLQNDYTPLYLKLKSLIYLQPKTSEIFGDRLSIAKPDSLSFQLITGALSAAGHPQAQAALSKVILQRVADTKVALMLIPSLSAVKNPTAETVKTLDQLASTPDPEVTTTAQLALGSVVAKLNSTEAKPIVDRFVQTLQTTKQPEEQRHLLLVLGNVGTSELLSVIEPFTQNQDAALKAAATAALRNIPDVRVTPILIQILEKDADDNVRLEAAIALGLREMTPESFSAQKATFTKDSSVKVRLAILNTLWQAREAYPEVVAIVKNAADKDSDKDVKETAMKLLLEP
ncbi:HEAT repeat domain-containing protein [Cyanobacteria bacterium FACHB-63]|nr:HEAT repeat domain-containing protein [Cyanobacteria bacterium FACHB-63]